MNTHSPHVRFFLDSIIALSHRAQLVVAVDGHDALVVRPFNRDDAENLDNAEDLARGMAPITAAIAARMGDDGLPTRMRHASDEADATVRELLLAGALEVERLRRGLARAIKEADDWHDEAHGGPIESVEFDALRALLPSGVVS